MAAYLFAAIEDEPGEPAERGVAPSRSHGDHLADAIVTRIRAGDAQAFSALFLDYHKRLWAFAYDLTHNSALADELVQEVFTALWIRRSNWVVERGIAAYLFGAVRNLAYKQRRHGVVTDRVLRRAETAGTSPAMGENPENAADQVVRHDLHARLEAAVARMPAGRREAILLRWREQLSYEEIAHVMGISVKAVSVQIARARQELRALIAEG